jgi:hypothetical protein
MALPAWNTRLFGCLTRDNTGLRSRARTAISASLPSPVVSRKADTSAPLELTFGFDVDDAGRRAWEQWTTYDLFDCSLPFTMFLPWGVLQPRVRAKLLGDWSMVRDGGGRWTISGTMEIERATLPRFSGGAHA